MDWASVGQALLNCLPSIIVAVAVLVGLWLYAKWSKSASPEDLKRREILGYVIMAVKAAEKIVPDTVENAWLKKADAAMKVFCETYTKYQGEPPTDAAKALFVNLKEQVLLELDKIKADKKAAEAAVVAPPVATTPAPEVK